MSLEIDITKDISSYNSVIKNYKQIRFINHLELEDLECIRDLDVSTIEIFDNLFQECTKLKDISALSSWKPNKITSCKYMFDLCWCLGIKTQYIDTLKNISHFPIENTDLSYMFSRCGNIMDASYLSSWKIDTCKVDYMFNKCIGLLKIPDWKYTMDSNIFYGCSNVFIYNIFHNDGEYVLSTRMNLEYHLPLYNYQRKDIRTLRFPESTLDKTKSYIINGELYIPCDDGWVNVYDLDEQCQRKIIIK